MKKIITIFFIAIANIGFGQGYPIQQNIGSGSTLVRVPPDGGFQASLINRNFVDTTAANATNIKYYPGSQIFTTLDTSLWIRNTQTTRWLRLQTSGQIINGDTINYLVDVNRPPGQLNVYGKFFNGISAYSRLLYTDSIGSGGGSSYTFPYSVVAPGNAIQLENDTTSLPANYFYGSNSAGRRTWLPQSSIGGTVTSVATNNGTGITGGTITGSGTLAIDTANTIATRLQLQHRIDSLAGTISGGALLDTIYERPSYTFINRLVNSTLPDTFTAIHPKGFNEFDIIPADDGTGDYEMVWDARTEVRYIRFHSPEDLQALIGTAAEKIIYTNTYSFPSIYKENGRYYIYVHKSSDGYMYLLEGNTIAELQAGTPRLIYNDFQSSDWSVKKNPRGGYISGGHIGGKARVFTAPFPAGPWKLKSDVFEQSPVCPSNPAYATNQADGVIFFKGGGIFYAFNGFHASRQTELSHNVIVELDTAYKAIIRPVEFIDQRSRSWHSQFFYSAYCYNAVYIENQGREEIWYVGSSGSIGSPDTGYIAHYQVGSYIDRPFAPPGTIARMYGGDSTDYGTNRKQNIIGTVANTSAGGFQTSSTNSGVWNFLNTTNLVDFDISCEFEVNAFPATGKSLIFTIGDTTTNHISLTVDSVGVLRANFIGTVPTTKVITGAVTLNTKRTVNIKRYQTNSKTGILIGYRTIVINNDAAQTYSDFQNFTNLITYSILNDSTDLVAQGRQLNGRVYSLQITSPPEELFVTNGTAGQFMTFNVLGQGQMYRTKTNKLAVTKSDYGYSSSEAGIYNDNTLGLTFLPELTTSGYNMSFINTSGNVWMRLNASNVYMMEGSGNLGVGTTSPSEKLDVSGNIQLKTAGNKIKIATGSNASVGQSAAMTAGSITISTTAVTSSSLIFLTHASVGGTQGILSVGTITNGTSFVINSSSALDTGTVNWWIVN